MVIGGSHTMRYEGEVGPLAFQKSPLGEQKGKAHGADSVNHFSLFRGGLKSKGREQSYFTNKPEA